MILLSEAAAERIQVARDSNNRAREKFDPKRFKRGGAYTEAEMQAIEKIAGHKRPTNEQLSYLEVYEFTSNPPDRFFAYYDKDMQHVKTFMGDVLGAILSKTPERKQMGGRVANIRVRGINGVMYPGTCNMSGGDYCNLRRVKG